jgi:hypothetical protein
MRPVRARASSGAGKGCGMIVIENAIDQAALRLLEAFAQGVVANRPPTEVIERKFNPYIDRWMLARKNLVPAWSDPYRDPPLSLERVASEIENLYLHRYHRADMDEPHCHPWPNATMVVTGFYVEDVYEDGVHIGSWRRMPGTLVLRRSDEVHAITSTGDGTLSLFATAPKEREWGFHVDGRIIPWQEHRLLKQAKAANG